MDTAPAVTQIGKYEIHGIVGRGGMGVVYRGLDNIGRKVAIKTLTDATPEVRQQLRQRFQDEARSGVLNHQNIVTVYEFGEADGNPYIAMEFVPGDSLEKILHSTQPLSLIDKLEVIRQVCDGLGYAHSMGVVHRDIKPANIMVQPDRPIKIKIVDFGIARLENASGNTVTGAVIGTFHYISPERLKGLEYDGRADIWSAGVMLYQMLTGRLPFGGENVSALHRVVSEPYDPLSNNLSEYPQALDLVIERALAKNPSERYAVAEEMAADLEDISEELKRGQVSEMLGQVRKMVDDDRLTNARPALLELQRLDPQNTEIRRMLREVQDKLARQQKSEQIRQLVAQGEEAALTQKYTEAIEFYKQAGKLDPGNHGLTGKIEHLRGLKERNDKVRSLLQQAREERHKENFAVAEQLIRQAMPLDERNTDLRNEHARILQEMERATKESARRKHVLDGREKLAARQYTEAIQQLREALQIDQTDADVQQLYQEAVSKQEEDRRRKVIEQIVAEIQECVFRREYERALNIVNRALERLPGEATLLRLKAETEKSSREQAAQRLVEEIFNQVQALFQTNTPEALACVQRGLDQIPGEPRLISLQERLVEQLKRANVEGLRGQYLKRAQAAMEGRQFDEAIQLLETAAIDCGESQDIAFLLEQTRNEKRSDERRQAAASAIQRAQALIGEGNLEAAIALLQPAAEEIGDPAVEQLLRQTSGSLAEVARRIDAVVAKVKELSSQDAARALQLLQSQPQAIQQHSKLRELRSLLDKTYEQEQQTRKAIEQAEACLANKDLRGGLDPLESVRRAYGDSAVLAAAVESYKQRRVTIADAMVLESVEAARREIMGAQPAQAVEALKGSAHVVELASAAPQADWQRLMQEAAQAAGTKKISTGTMQIVVKSKGPSVLAIAGVMGAVFAVIGVVAWFTWPAPAAPQGWLELNATPFAEVVTVTSEKGKAVALPEGDHSTPLRLDGLAPGKYTVVFKGDGGNQTVSCSVGDSQQVCSAQMRAVSDDDMKLILGGVQ